MKKTWKPPKIIQNPKWLLKKQSETILQYNLQPFVQMIKYIFLIAKTSFITYMQYI